MDFAEKKKLLDKNDWNTMVSCYCEVALKLENADADCLVLCANTPHTIANEITKAIHIPLIHIAEATADEIAKQQLKKVGLPGTRFTMEQSFYKDKLSAKGIAVFTPGETDRVFINNSIFNEMAKGIFSPETKERYLSIINNMTEQGAEGIIFGCTEIPLLIKPGETTIPAFDTTLIHANASVKYALEM